MAESLSTEPGQPETRWRDLRTGLVFVAGLLLAAVLGLIIGPTGILRYDKAWKQP